MFDRFIRLSRAKKALREQRFEDALQQALDPVIRADRRAEEVRVAAVAKLMQRAQARFEQRDLSAARALAERVRAIAGAATAVELLAAIDGAERRQEGEVVAARQALSAARAAIEAGDLDKAEALLATAPAAERQALERDLRERRGWAREAVAAGDQHLARGEWRVALQDLQRAVLLARDHADVVGLRQRLVEPAAAACAAEVDARLAAADLPAAMAAYRTLVAALPEVRENSRGKGIAERLGSRLHEALRAQTAVGEAVALAEAVTAVDLELPPATARLLEAVLAIRVPAAGGAAADASTRAMALAAAAEACGASPLVVAAKAWLQANEDDANRLVAARASADRGDLDGARQQLADLLAEQPLHEAARRELELLDQSVADLERRLHEVRAALRAGRLRQACTLAVGLGGHTRIGAEAQQLAAQARASMALVDRGLDEVRVALHGRTAATQEGLRHSLKRLEELAKVQSDHAELPGVVQAVEAEIAALGVFDRATQALDRGNLGEVLQGCGELLGLRERLLAPARLEARVLDLADGLARFAEVALAAGRLADVERCAGQFAAMAGLREEFAAKAAMWRDGVRQRRERAEALVESARLRLGERDLGEAERLAEDARQQWLECDGAKVLLAELRVIRKQADALARVADLTDERDFAGAQQKLAAMSVTPPLLRTRIYDMKQNLARAQGLEGAFLLRVDEGGEHLVLRGESISIGNVRQNRADLPVLANLAGRHATIRRSMSFHGGMQDTIVAEEGEVRVAGQAVQSRALAAGERVQLGPALGLVYQRPTSRSLTVGLALQSGFQVAGTDRILLMKDRGRDGRILLGPGADVHVRVARATGEVEIFANNAGQMRVACAQGGTIDGVPFQGEHPLAAGQHLEVAGISFHLLPWRPTA